MIRRFVSFSGLPLGRPCAEQDAAIYKFEEQYPEWKYARKSPARLTYADSPETLEESVTFDHPLAGAIIDDVVGQGLINGYETLHLVHSDDSLTDITLDVAEFIARRIQNFPAKFSRLNEELKFELVLEECVDDFLEINGQRGVLDDWIAELDRRRAEESR